MGNKQTNPANRVGHLSKHWGPQQQNRVWGRPAPHSVTHIELWPMGTLDAGKQNEATLPSTSRGSPNPASTHSRKKPSWKHYQSQPGTQNYGVPQREVSVQGSRQARAAIGLSGRQNKAGDRNRGKKQGKQRPEACLPETRGQSWIGGHRRVLTEEWTLNRLGTECPG